jgi:hypothetical protein
MVNQHWALAKIVMPLPFLKFLHMKRWYLSTEHGHLVLASDTINQCCGSGMFIPDLIYDFFPSRIPDPGLTRSRIWILIKELKNFNPKIDTKFLKNTIRDLHPGPGSGFFPSRIPDPGVKKTPHPEFGSATLVWTQYCDTHSSVLDPEPTSRVISDPDPTFTLNLQT